MRSLPNVSTHDQQWELNLWPFDFESSALCGALSGGYSVIPLVHRAFGSSFTRRKQGLFLLVTYGKLLCYSLMDLICVSVWSALSSIIGTFSPHQITSDTSDTDLIVDKHKSDSSDCNTIVFRRWPEEIDLASDEWRMSQKFCGTGV